jgi:porin
MAVCTVIGATAWAQSATPGLLGEAGGIRTDLSAHGVTLGLTDSENLLGSIAGGIKHGATMQGVTTGTLEVDTGKAFGLQGGTFHITALQIHGQPLTPAYLGTLQAANGNEAEDTTRLWELWYDQTIPFAQGDLKIGQQSIDNEFIVSQYSGLFVNTMAGWPLVPSADLYGGGPAYPLASLGGRVQLKPATNTTILAGAFDDNPGGGSFSDDAQALDHSGSKFNLRTGALFIAELQYQVTIKPGTYKIGAWYDTGTFPDQRIGTDGISLANPASNGTPKMLRDDYSLYAVADQTVWQSTADSSRTLNLFTRLMVAPDDRNLITFSINGGVTLAAPLIGRDNDQAGLDLGLGKVSNGAGGLNRSMEELIELTYQAQATPWLSVQPDIQYVINPGAGIQLRNELVAGVRANVTF